MWHTPGLILPGGKLMSELSQAFPGSAGRMQVHYHSPVTWETNSFCHSELLSSSSVLGWPWRPHPRRQV